MAGEPGPWLKRILAVLAVVAIAGLLWWLFRGDTRPLPYFRSVKFFNGSSATKPDTVKVTFGATSGDATGDLRPNGRALYLPGTASTSVTSVTVDITIPDIAAGSTQLLTIVATPPTPIAGRIITDVFVILSDADDVGAEKFVKAECRVLWFSSQSEPHWGWWNPTPPVPVRTRGDYTQTDPTQLDLEEVSLLNLGTALNGVVLRYDYAATFYTDTHPQLLAGKTFDLPRSGIFDVSKVTAQVTTPVGGPVYLQIAPPPPGEHLHAAYFFATPSAANTSISKAGLVQRAVPPYWQFR